MPYPVPELFIRGGEKKGLGVDLFASNQRLFSAAIVDLVLRVLSMRACLSQYHPPSFVHNHVHCVGNGIFLHALRFSGRGPQTEIASWPQSMPLFLGQVLSGV